VPGDPHRYPDAAIEAGRKVKEKVQHAAQK
jgi:hypothetical protein